MAILKAIMLPKGGLPDKTGVYIMKNKQGKVLYVGKATSLKRRVSSYWRAQEAISRPKVVDLIGEVALVDVQLTGTVLEALILEANLIKKYRPPYNILQKDDRSFLYLVLTNEAYPKPILIRGHELKREGKKKYKKIFGPYLQPAALKAALKLIRKFIPWSTCEPPSAKAPAGRPPDQKSKRKPRACFYYHLGQCPGVCVAAVSRRDYSRTVQQFTLFFEGKTKKLKEEIKKDMRKASDEQRYEDAQLAKRRLYALDHINDVAVLTKEDNGLFGHPRKEKLAIDIFGRIEGYDISNISGTSAVGSMVVFEDAEPKKSAYRKFKIRTVKGADDYAMIAEVLRRRFTHKEWALPDLILIDGGLGQVNVARRVLKEFRHKIPIVGIAKGFDRKQDKLVYSKSDAELGRIVESHKAILQRLRDEAHRFAIKYHRKVRSKRLKGVDK